MRHALGTAVAVAALLLAACGGSDNEDPASDPQPATTSSAVSKTEFIEQADDLCREFRKKRDAIDEPDKEDLPKQADAVKKLADTASDLLDRLQQLEPPAGDEAVIRRYVRLGREQIVVINRAGEALDSGNAEQANALIESAREPGGKLKGIAQGYGFKVCGSEED